MRRPLIKRLKRSQVTKSDIITITAHSNEGVLDAYDNGDALQQEALSNFIDNIIPRAVHYRSNIISPDHPVYILTKRLIFSQEKRACISITAQQVLTLKLKLR